MEQQSLSLIKIRRFTKLKSLLSFSQFAAPLPLRRFSIFLFSAQRRHPPPSSLVSPVAAAPRSKLQRRRCFHLLRCLTHTAVVTVCRQFRRCCHGANRAAVQTWSLLPAPSRHLSSARRSVASPPLTRNQHRAAFAFGLSILRRPVISYLGRLIS